jgi:hypothetical protein
MRDSRAAPFPVVRLGAIGFPRRRQHSIQRSLVALPSALQCFVQVDFQTVCEARTALRLLQATDGAKSSSRASAYSLTEAAPLRRFELCARLFERCDVDIASAIGRSVAEAEAQTQARGSGREALLHDTLALMRLAVDHHAVLVSDLSFPSHLRQVLPGMAASVQWPM